MARDNRSAIDIVVTTRNRLHLLPRTINHILTRTRSPYRLHVIDDRSENDLVRNYLLSLYEQGRIHNLVLRRYQAGQLSNLNVAVWLTYSDPVVLTDDDVLCPDVEPDWLARGRKAMLRRPKLGVLALDHPGAARGDLKRPAPDGVTYCSYVGGTFMFVRREVLLTQPLPHHWHDFGTTPTTIRCQQARNNGWQIGYLTGTYCEHVGEISVLTNRAYRNSPFIPVKDEKTLEPIEGV